MSLLTPSIGLTKIIPIAVYIVFIIGVLLTIFYRPKIGVFILLPLLPAQSLVKHMEKFPLGKDFIDFLVIAIIIGWLMRKDKIPYQKTLMNKYVYWLIIITFFGVVIGSLKEGMLPISLSNNIFLSWKNFIIMPIVYFIALNFIDNEKEIILLFILMLIIIFVMNQQFYEVAQWRPKDHFSYDERVAGSTFSYLGPNELASFFAQYFLFFFGVLLFTLKDKNKRLLNLFIIASLCFSIYAILFSYSRGAWIALLLGIIYLGFLKNRMILVLFVVFILIYPLVLPQSVLERIDNTVGEGGVKQGADAGRFGLYKSGIQNFLSSGVGIGFDRSRRTGIRRDPHNMYIKMLAELGVQGLIIYLCLYYFGFKYAWRLYKNGITDLQKGIGLGFTATILANSVNNVFGQNWIFTIVTGYYWAFSGIAIRCLMDDIKPLNRPIRIIQDYKSILG